MADATVTVDGGVTPRLARATLEDLKDPQKLLKLLERALLDIAALSRDQRANPVRESLEFRDMSVTSGTAFTLRHGLMRRVRYMLVDASAACTLYRSAFADDTITLVPSATATISVMVF